MLPKRGNPNFESSFNSGNRFRERMIGLMVKHSASSLSLQTQPLASNLRRRNDGNEEDRPKVTLVVFMGGCTFAEISALRFLSQQEDSNTGD